jgi:flagellar hook-associated protein 1
VTTPPPAGTDPLLTARGIRLAPTMTSAAAVAVSGGAATGPGDNTVALTMAGLRDATQTLTSSTGATVATTTVGDYFDSIVGDVATSTSQADDELAVKNTMTSNAQTRRQSTSSVSTDEELISVIQHQHAYQAAARLINVVDEMMQTLVGLGQ